MINVGEATGALDTMLAKIADFYEEEVDTAVAGLLTLLEPLMIAVPRRRRRRHRHLDVPADLRPDQQADEDDRDSWADARGRPAAASVVDRAARALVATVLLGSAIWSCSSPARPSAGRSVLRADRRRLRADGVLRARLSRTSTASPGSSTSQLAIDALVVSASSALTGGVTSHSRRSTCCRSSPPASSVPRAAALLVARSERVAVRGRRARAVLRQRRASRTDRGAATRRLPPLRVAQFTVGLNAFGFFAVAAPERDRSPRALRPRRRAARAGVQRDRRSAGLQPARHRQPDERSRHDRRAKAAADLQPRRRGDHRPRAATVVGRPVADVLQLPPAFVERSSENLRSRAARADRCYYRARRRGASSSA